MNEAKEPTQSPAARFAARVFPSPPDIDPELDGKEKKDAEVAHAAATTEAFSQRAALIKSGGKELEAMARRLAPPKAGTYLVTPPPYGCKNPYTGEFKPGDKPREMKLTAKAVLELARPGQPFKLKLVPNKAAQE